MKIEVKGVDKLLKTLKDTSKYVESSKKIVKKNGAEFQKSAMKNARHSASGGVFAKGYSTGHTRRNLQQNGVKLSDDGLTATVQSTTDYAAYVEHGTRFMAAQPYMKPAFNKQKKVFIEEMDKELKKLTGGKK